MVYTVDVNPGKTKKIKVREAKKLAESRGLLFLQWSKAGGTTSPSGFGPPVQIRWRIWSPGPNPLADLVPPDQIR